MKFILLALLLVAVTLVSIELGRYQVSLYAWQRFLFDPRNGDVATLVLLRVRLPRIIGGLLIGAGLSASGAAYQGLFRNPIVSPDLLGASAGAGVGAAIAILLGWGSTAIEGFSFLGGLAAVGATSFVARRVRRGNDPVLALVLSGLMIASICEALISLTKTVADPDLKLPAITFWLMGSLASVDNTNVFWLLILIPLGILALMLMRWKLNVLAMGEEEAASLGVDTRTARLIVVLSATVVTTAAVSLSGMIGWVGLVIPHVARMLVGPNYKVLLPASVMLGGSYMMLVDDIARTATAAEIPLGILTHLIGAPFFLYLLIRMKQEWA